MVLVALRHPPSSSSSSSDLLVLGRPHDREIASEKASMHGLLRYLSCGLLAPLCLFGSAGAATAVFDRYAGSFAASGAIVEGPNANAHQVRCRFTASRGVQRGCRSEARAGPIRSYCELSVSILIGIPNRVESRARTRDHASALHS
jgi:hypothetical protein